MIKEPSAARGSLIAHQVNIQEITWSFHLLMVFLMLPVNFILAGAIFTFIFLDPSSNMGWYISIPFPISVFASTNLIYVKHLLVRVSDGLTFRILDVGIHNHLNLTKEYQDILEECRNKISIAFWIFLCPLWLMLAILVGFICVHIHFVLFTVPFVILAGFLGGVDYIDRCIGWSIGFMKKSDQILCTQA